MLTIQSAELEFVIRELKSPEANFAKGQDMGAKTEDLEILPESWTNPSGCAIVAIALKSVHATMRIGEATIVDGSIAAGTSILTRSDEHLSVTLSRPFHFVTIAFRKLHRHDVKLSQAEQREALIVRDTLVEQLGRTLNEDYDADASYFLAAVQIITSRLDRLSQPNVKAKALPKWRLKKVQQFVETRLDEPIFLQDLADAAGLSRMHFASQFRASTGLRPHDYVLQQRVERAKKLMLETDAQLVEIALEVGFQAQSHFSTIYKRLTGETPGAWRRRLAREPKQLVRSSDTLRTRVELASRVRRNREQTGVYDARNP